MFCNEKFFRRVKKVITIVPWICERAQMLWTFHDRLGYQSQNASHQLIAELFCRSAWSNDVSEYVRSCIWWQLSQTITPYQATLRLPITNLFETYSINFAGPLTPIKSGMEYILVAVKHVMGWLLVKSTIDATSGKVVPFLKEDIIYHLGVPGRIISIHRSCFRSMKPRTFSNNADIKWIHTLYHEPDSNGKEGRMAGTLKLRMKKIGLQIAEDWDDSLKTVLYGNRLIFFEDAYSPFELIYSRKSMIVTSRLYTLLLNHMTDTWFESTNIDDNRCQCTMSILSAAKKNDLLWVIKFRLL